MNDFRLKEENLYIIYVKRRSKLCELSGFTDLSIFLERSSILSYAIGSLLFPMEK